MAQYLLGGQYYGANKKEDTQEVIGTMFTLGLIISLFIMIFMWVITNPLLNILRTPDEAFIDARKYVTIASSGIVFIFGYNAISAILRGLGDSKRPVVYRYSMCIQYFT